MNRDRIMRRALWFSVFYNVMGAAMFAFPASSLGQLSGMPTSVPPLYSTLVALFVLLFGGAYAFLAMQPVIDRPLVALGAIGKAGAFAVFVGTWLAGDFSGLGVLAGAGDLILAAIFCWWLLSSPA